MKLKKNQNFEYITILVSLVTIISTPWLNSDSLIIPKLIFLSCGAFYLVPQILIANKVLFQSKYAKFFTLILFAYSIQLILVFIFSNAPFEQQFYGRTGRGLGLIFESSLIILMLIAYIYCDLTKIRFLLIVLVLTCFVSTFYSILQKFNLDIFEWNTRTNGIIGTLGNPNFQSSFAAMSLIPAMTIFFKSKYGLILSVVCTLPILYVIFITQSTQGYILVLSSVSIFFITYFWFKSRLISILFTIFLAVGAFFTFIGMQNRGPLAYLLYKVSVQSRSEMYDTALNIIRDKPFFGVGLDSIGDYYFMYRSEASANGIGEFVDNVHNVFLNYAASGGLLLFLLYFLITLMTLNSFYIMQKRLGKFDLSLTSLFCVWASYQIQSLISPNNISMAAWNAIISGFLIGLASESENRKTYLKSLQEKFYLLKPFGYMMLILGICISYPYYKVDHEQLKSAQTGDALLALKSAKSFPESSVRYARIGQEFINSNLGPQALELGRAAVQFNPNALSAWSLLLINNSTPRPERVKAKAEMIRLDPFNNDIKNLNIP